MTYEQAWASEVKAAWEQEKSSGQDVTTGLAIGTKELVHGRKIGSRNVTVANNLYSRVEDVNATLARQGGEQIITSYGSGYAPWQSTATEVPDFPSNVHSVDFTDGDNNWDHKGNDHSSSRPVVPPEWDAVGTIESIGIWQKAANDNSGHPDAIRRFAQK